MSSDVQSTLALLQLNDYVTLGTATAVIYDYCLTISNEVTYIWNRPWTRVSTLFLLIRYVGCFTALITVFVGSTFIPGPVKVRHSSSEFLSITSPQTNDIRPVSISNDHPQAGTKFTYFRGYIFYVLNGWAHGIFYIAADMVMILRVYAMYNRSKMILSVLLVIYLTEVVILFVGGGFYSDPNYDKASISEPLNIAVCSIVLSTQTWNIAAATVQCILGTPLCILAVAQFMRESVQMYQATRVWQLNRYIRILTRDGLFYFLATLFYALITVLSNTQSIRQGSGTLLVIAIADVLLYTLTPRFVINVRELYTLDSHGHLNGGIDTGFGLTSGGTRGVGGSTTIDTIVFMEAGATRALEDGEGTAMVEGRTSDTSDVLVS